MSRERKQTSNRRTQFSHLDPTGAARMVDVSNKPVTRRVAAASCFVRMSEDTVSRLQALP